MKTFTISSVFVVLSLLSFQVCSQQKTAFLTDLLTEAIHSEQDTVRFTNLKISVENLSDGQTPFSYIDEMFPGLSKDSGKILLPRLEFIEVSGRLELHNFSFPKGLKIGDNTSSNPYRVTEKLSLHFDGCDFNGLQVNVGIVGGIHILSGNKYDGSIDLKFKDSERIIMVSGKFNIEKLTILLQNCNTVHYSMNKVYAANSSNSEIRKDIQNERVAFLHLDDVKEVIMWDNEFNTLLDISGFPSGRNASLLDIQRNIFEYNIGFSVLNVADQFIFLNNTLKENISFSQFVFPELYVKTDWEQLRGNKVYVKVSQSFDEGPDGFACIACLPYYGLTDEELSRSDRFNELVANYASLHNIFKSKGDIMGANGSYAELQQLYTRLYRYHWRNVGSMKNWFRWRLNQLLDFYMSYGTDPAKALIITFYILLAFAIVYFFFPSEWDISVKQDWLVAIRKMFSREEQTTFQSVGKLFFLFGLNLLNAFTLSINSFVTLGFGAIPTRGISRYLCVLQGFIGWFLLSLFTVAIINQVIF
ncbi:MAG: hypothetical protein JXQ90_13685 [Cyclobacteriaceae bacterium]